MWLRLLRERQEVLSVAATQRSAFDRVLEPLERILADRLQHPEAFLGVTEQALVDERLERVETGLRDVLSGLESTAAGEDSQARKQPPLLLGEQLV